jgi:hypothetical protein
MPRRGELPPRPMRLMMNPGDLWHPDTALQTWRDTTRFAKQSRLLRIAAND